MNMRKILVNGDVSRTLGGFKKDYDHGTNHSWMFHAGRYAVIFWIGKTFITASLTPDEMEYVLNLNW